MSKHWAIKNCTMCEQPRDRHDADCPVGKAMSNLTPLEGLHVRPEKRGPEALELLFQLRELIGRDDDNEGRYAVNAEMFRLCDMLEAEVKRLRELLMGLTPGGSEFVSNPDRCAEFVRERLALLASLAKARNRERERAEAYKELAEAYERWGSLDAARERVRKAEA